MAKMLGPTVAPAIAEDIVVDFDQQLNDELPNFEETAEQYHAKRSHRQSDFQSFLSLNEYGFRKTEQDYHQFNIQYDLSALCGKKNRNTGVVAVTPIEMKLAFIQDELARSQGCKKLIRMFVLNASPMSDVEFMGRFLNSDPSIRTIYDGRRLTQNGYVKFFMLLRAIDNMDEMIYKKGMLYKLLRVSAARHVTYNTNSVKLYQKLFHAILWTFRNQLGSLFTTEHETLLEWAVNHICTIYTRSKPLHKMSVRRRLVLSRRRSINPKICSETVKQLLHTKFEKKKKQQNGKKNEENASNIASALAMGQEPRDMTNYLPHHGSSVDCLDEAEEEEILAGMDEAESRNILALQTQKTVAILPQGTKIRKLQMKHNNDMFLIMTSLRAIFRVQQLMDQVSDILVSVRLFTAINTTPLPFRYNILLALIMTFYLLPYIILGTILHKTVKRRFAFVYFPYLLANKLTRNNIKEYTERSSEFLRDNDDDSLHNDPGSAAPKHTETVTGVTYNAFFYIFDLFYMIVVIPILISIDLYVYIAKLFSNLADTKYLYQYWKLKGITDTCFESIPQSILLTLLLVWNDANDTTVQVEVVPLGLIIFGVLTSVLNATLHVAEIQRAGEITKRGFFGYIKHHLVDFKMLPWSDGLMMNQVKNLHITNDLVFSEWLDFVEYIKVNTSLEYIRVSVELGLELSLSVLRGLRTNKIYGLNVSNCCLFSTHNTSRIQMGRHNLKSTYVQRILTRDELNEDDNMSQVTNDHNDKLTISSSINLSHGKKDIVRNMRSDISSDEVAIELARLIDRNPNLGSLKLRGNQIADLSVFLFGSIINSKSLRVLDLSDNNLSTETCGNVLSIHLYNIIEASSLNKLILDDNELDTMEAIAIADAINNRERIMQELSLAHNNIPKEYVELIETVNQTCNKVKLLNLTDNPTTQSGVASHFKSAQRMTF